MNTVSQAILTARLDEAVRGAKKLVFTSGNKTSLDRHLAQSALSTARLEKAVAKMKHIVYRGV